MSSTKIPFVRTVSRLFWTGCNLQHEPNYRLALSMFYLGYTEMSVKEAVRMNDDDPVRQKYIEIARSMGMSFECDSIIPVSAV